MRVLRPALEAGFAALVLVLLVARALRRPVAAWLGTPEHSGSWALLVATAAVATLGLGAASLWHALVLTRLIRVRAVDRLIAALGIGWLLLAVGIGVLAATAPQLARLALVAAAPLWLAGVAAAALALAMVIHAQRASRHPTPGTVVILGAGLQGRSVGPLLRRRVARGAELWRAAVATRPDARIVVAGGQGPDEVRTEASAMAEHLVEHLGVPPEAIDLEDASTSTRENLLLSKPLLERPRAAPVVVVTSEYHAYRTAWLVAEAGLDATVVGAWTRRSYLPGATVREALAVASDLRWWCVGAALVAWGLAGWLLAAGSAPGS